MRTVQDVAKRAGVSTATVSRVFSDSDRVATKTRQHVLKVANSMGYVPNFAAPSLRISNSKEAGSELAVHALLGR